MARLRSKADRDKAAAAEAEATVDTTQEGAEEQAPQTEENAVTVTEPEVEQTEPEVEQTVDADATPEAAESGEAQAPAEGESGEAPAEKSKDDLEAEFRAKCEEAVANSDETTGSVPEIFASKVLEAYRNLPSTASKSIVKNWLGEEMRNALIGNNEQKTPDVARARALSDINAKVQDASTRRSAAAPAKPTVSPSEQYLASCMALDLAKQFVPRPAEGELDENFQEQYHQRYSDLTAEGGDVQKYLTWLGAAEGERGDEPEVDQIVKNAAKLASGRAIGGRKSSAKRSTGGSTGGPRRNVGAHIDEFLAQADPNAEYTVADVANFSSTEYGEDHPSPGAVAARLFPSNGKASTIQGFEQVPNVEPKKIRKI